MPSFLLVGRLDVVEVIGETIDATVGGGSGVRPVAERVDVPHATARDWVRRFRRRAGVWAAALAAAVVEVAGVAPRLPGEDGRAVLAALGWLVAGVRARAGPSTPGRWVLAAVVTGGRMLGATTDPLSIFLGGRRLMPPVP